MSYIDRLKKIRTTFGMTQQEFAQELGISYRTLQRYEEGEKFPKGMEFLLDLIMKGVSVDWLLTGDGELNRMVNPEFVPILREINLWLDVISKEDEGYIDWFRIEFCKRFPEFVEWTENEGKENIQLIRKNYKI